MQDFTRRSEAQKRGNQHEHYIYWMESCGIVFGNPAMARIFDGGTSQTGDAGPVGAAVKPASTDGTVRGNDSPSLNDTEPVGAAVRSESSEKRAKKIRPDCTHISRYCLRLGDQCRLPEVLNGTEPHKTAHHAYAQC